MAFKDVLKKLRIQDELSQGDLADKLGVCRSTVSMWEHGQREPGFEMLEIIADYFNVPMSTLIDKSPAPADGNEAKRQEFIRLYDSAPGWVQDQVRSLLRAAESAHEAQGVAPKG